LNCRHCGAALQHAFLDLGFAPPANNYLSREDLSQPEVYLPLRLSVCEQCWLVQTDDYARPEELFRDDYAYFSSTSKSWLKHGERFSSMICERLNLGPDSFVIEVGCNDGYLLKNFVASGIPCLGIEPCEGVAAAAKSLSVPVLTKFFDEELGKAVAAQKNLADLIICNNVYAHVPDINSFTAGLKVALKPGGTITLEFPHLLKLMQGTQFDTVYHEHYSYFSLFSVQRIFSAFGLRVWDVEELDTHGGSLRVFGCHREDARIATPAVGKVLDDEIHSKMRVLATYNTFQSDAEQLKDNLLSFLIQAKKEGAKVAAYGAAAKGNTLLNYAGIKPDLLPYVCDAAASKQGKFLPGSHLPIVAPDRLRDWTPDFVLILPWNLADEIIAENRYIRAWSGKFFTAIPELRVIS
jgi:SAM-dependent methyltransferase